MSYFVDPDRNEARAIHALVDFRGRNVLEIGCGNGRLMWRYADQTATALGIDSVESDIDLARSSTPEHLRHTVTFRTVDALTADFASASFDVVVLGRSI